MLRRLIALAIASAVAPNVLLLCMTGLGGGGHGGGDLFGVASNCHHSHGIYDELHGEQHCGPGPDGPAPAAVGTWSSGAKGSFRLPVASAATYRSSHSAHGGPSAATVLGATVLAAGGVGSGTAASSTRRSMDASDNRTPTTLDAMRLNYGADAPPETLKVSVLGAFKGASENCLFAKVEFQNTHPTDHIFVHNTYIEPSVLFPNEYGDPSTFSNTPSPTPYMGREYYPLHRQLFVQAGATVTIPVSIVPSCRSPATDFAHEDLENYPWIGWNDAEHVATMTRNFNITRNGTEYSWFAETDRVGGDGGAEDPPPSPASATDLLQMAASHPPPLHPSHRSELYAQAEVHETLVANTSWGFVQMKVPYICSPDTAEYRHGLPNSLMFLDGGGGWYARRNTTPTIELAHLFGAFNTNPTRDTADPFVYHVYMNNPSESLIHVHHVSATKPELIDLYVRKRVDPTAREQSLAIDLLDEPSRRILWSYPFKSEQFVKAATNNVYVCSIRLNPHAFTADMVGNVADLGFLRISTNVHDFHVGLDYVPNGRRNGVIHGVTNRTMLEDVQFVLDEVLRTRLEEGKRDGLLEEADGYGHVGGGDGGSDRFSCAYDDGKKCRLAGAVVKSYTRPDQRLPLNMKDFVPAVAIPKSAWKDEDEAKEKAVEEEGEVDVDEDAPPSMDGAGGNPNLGGDTVRISPEDSLLRIMPARVDFGSITTGSRTISLPVMIRSVHTKPLCLMRFTLLLNSTDVGNGTLEVGLEFSNEDKIRSANTKAGTGKRWDGRSGQLEFPHEVVLPAPTSDDHFVYTFTIWCKFTTDSAEDVSSSTFGGSLIVRATDDWQLSYEEWSSRLILDGGRGGGAGDAGHVMIEVPFSGHILPGSLGSPTEALLFPTNPHVLPPEERARVQHTLKSRHYDRRLELTNNFGVEMNILDMRIVDAEGDDGYCGERFAVRGATPSSVLGGALTAGPGEGWPDLHIRYRFKDEADFGVPGATTAAAVSRKCMLSITTDLAGKQSLPLLVYSGEVMVDLERPDGGTHTVHCVVTKKRGDERPVISKSGLPCMHDWVANTDEGRVLKQAIGRVFKSRSTVLRKKCPSHSGNQVDVYFKSFTSGFYFGLREERQHFEIQPIVIPFGAIDAGSEVKRNILITNHNHVPINVWAPTALIGNMRVEIGIAERRSAPIWTDREDEKDDIAFLKHNPVAKKFFDEFRYETDISASLGIDKAGAELRPLFRRQFVRDIFVNSTEYLNLSLEDSAEKMECADGLVLSSDGNVGVHLDQRIRGRRTWTIPSGGVARFVVTVDAQPKESLTNDVTPFIGTGLTLETDHGQVFPIVVTYSVIKGQLNLTPALPGQSGAKPVKEMMKGLIRVGDDYRVKVPLTMKDSAADHFNVSGRQDNMGTPLFIESTFNQDIYLSEIRSCNKWFNIFLPSNTAAAKNFFSKTDSLLLIKGTNKTSDHRMTYTTRVPLGKVLSSLACSHPSGDKSFYACALSWIENYAQIQPPGCGLPQQDVVIGLDGLDINSRISQAKSEAMGSLRDVVAWMSVRYADKDTSSSGSGSKSNSDYVHFSRIHMFNHAIKAWGQLVELGLNIVTGHITAKTVYFPPEGTHTTGGKGDTPKDSDEVRHGSPLSIPVTSMLLQSNLEIPKLFSAEASETDSSDDDIAEVNFGYAHVADTSSRMIRVSNPSAMSVRVRLAAVDSLDGSFGEDDFAKKNVYLQGVDDDNAWWSGGSYWMSDGHGNLISALHNVTIKSGAGAYVSLLNPSVQTGSSFLLGCGRRCGLRADGDNQGDEKLYSPIGAGSSSKSVLLGRSHVTNQDDKGDANKALGHADPPAFALGRAASQEVVVPPHGTTELGPVHFRPPGKGDFDGSIYIENSLTGFEEVKVSGQGTVDQLVILDETLDGGGNVEYRFGKSTLVFPGTLSQNEGGNGELIEGPVVRKALVSNQGKFPAEVTNIYMASSEVMHFTHKRQHPQGSSSNSGEDNPCLLREFVIAGCQASPGYWYQVALSWYDYISTFVFKLLGIPPPEGSASRSKGRKPHFTINPGESRSITVLHYPDCTFQTSYVSLNFDIKPAERGQDKRRQNKFRQRKLELLIGYDMNAWDFRHCVPYTAPSMSFWDSKITIQMPIVLQDVLSFGLTRLKDSNGNPYIPRRPIVVTYWAAAFIFLLFALSLDLLFAVELAGTRLESPLWKSTCRCLARTDPTAPELTTIGKEQTKHVLLSRFKKEGIRPTVVVQSDGSFTRSATGLNTHSTHSDAIFERFKAMDAADWEGDLSDDVTGPASFISLPCGIGWRAARRRGIDFPVDDESNDHLRRTRYIYAKKQQEHKLTKIIVSPSDDADARPSVSFASEDIVSNGENSRAATSKAAARPAPQAKDDYLPSNGKGKNKKNTPHARQSSFSSVPQQTKALAPKGSVKNNKSNVTPAPSSSTYAATPVRKQQKVKSADSGKSKPSESKSSAKQDTTRLAETKKNHTNPTKTSAKSKSRLNTKSSTEDVIAGFNSKTLHSKKPPTAPKTVAYNVNEGKTTPRKLSSNGSNVGQTGGKQKANSRKQQNLGIQAKPAPKSRASSKDSEFPPLSAALQSPSQTPISENSLFRPPPGILAPPGFLDQPETKTSPRTTSPLHSSVSRRTPSTVIPGLNIGAPVIKDLMPSARKNEEGSPDGLLRTMSTESPGSGPLDSAKSPIPLVVPAFQEEARGHGSPFFIIEGEMSATAKPFIPQNLVPPPPLTHTSPKIEPQIEPKSKTEKKPDVSNLLDPASSDFNVTNFLDGILSDSIPQRSPQVNASSSSSDDIGEAIPLGSKPIGVVSLDPWNIMGTESSSSDPLAVLQGTVVNQTANDEPLIAGIPLTGNVPSLFGGSANRGSSLLGAAGLKPTTSTSSFAEPACLVSDDGGGEDESVELEPDSFYSQLLGE